MLGNWVITGYHYVTIKMGHGVYALKFENNTF